MGKKKVLKPSFEVEGLEEVLSKVNKLSAKIEELNNLVHEINSMEVTLNFEGLKGKAEEEEKEWLN